jgi:hypothetical protein
MVLSVTLFGMGAERADLVKRLEKLKLQLADLKFLDASGGGSGIVSGHVLDFAWDSRRFTLKENVNLVAAEIVKAVGDLRDMDRAGPFCACGGDPSEYDLRCGGDPSEYDLRCGGDPSEYDLRCDNGCLMGASCGILSDSKLRCDNGCLMGARCGILSDSDWRCDRNVHCYYGYVNWDSARSNSEHLGDVIWEGVRSDSEDLMDVDQRSSSSDIEDRDFTNSKRPRNDSGDSGYTLRLYSG